MPAGSAQWAYGKHNKPEARCALCGDVNALRMEGETFLCSDADRCRWAAHKKRKFRVDSQSGVV